MLYADVVLPLPLADTFTYSVPEEMEREIGIGFRVVVPFGNRKHYTAIVLKLHRNAPAGVEVKRIYSLTDRDPVLNGYQIRLWEWIAYYYLSPLGDVFRAALPSVMKPRNLEERYRSKREIHVRINRDIADSDRLTARSKKQAALLQSLKRLFEEEGIASLPQKEIPVRTGFSNAVLQGLIEKGLVIRYTEEVSRLETHPSSQRKSFELN